MKQSIYLRLLLSPLVAVSLMASIYSPAIFAKASDDIIVVKPYARAIPPGQPNSASFMQLKNTSDTNHAVVSAKSDVAAVVELHTHTHKDGMMQMRRVDKIELPAQESVTLKPGGLHIMLIKLHKTLEMGQTVNITLEFADGSSIDVKVPVQKIMMEGMMMKMKMKH